MINGGGKKKKEANIGAKVWPKSVTYQSYVKTPTALEYGFRRAHGGLLR